MSIYEFIGFISAIIGILSFMWFLHERRKPFRRISWRTAKKASNRIADQLIKDKYTPSIIFGIGRGGAIFGSMISASLGHCALVVVDRKYNWLPKGRVQDILFPICIPSEYLKSVLLVAGEAHSGTTMNRYYDHLKVIGAHNIKRAVLYFEDGCPTNIEYYGLNSSDKKLLLPWMDNKRYIRQDRIPQIEQQSKHKIKIYFIRHAETSANEDIFTGLNDYDLTVEGIEQALNVGHFFTSKNIKVIYSSPLGRAQKTAKIIRDFIPGRDLISSNLLKEINFGAWEGLSRSEIMEKYGTIYTKWNHDPIMDFPENGESPQIIIERMKSFLSEVVNNFSAYESTEIIAVTHKTFMRILVSYFKRISLKDYRTINIKNCEIITIVYDGKNWEINEE